MNGYIDVRPQNRLMYSQFSKTCNRQNSGFLLYTVKDPSNRYGLFNMAGNVWEWVEDWWTTRHSALSH